MTDANRLVARVEGLAHRYATTLALDGIALDFAKGSTTPTC
jgi:hypothetical protein